MREKFLTYLNQIGIRYALRFAKYEGIALSTVQLWITEDDSTVNTQQLDDVTWMYNAIRIPNTQYPYC